MIATGLAQRLEGRLARGRAAALARMTSRVTIHRKGDPLPMGDDDTTEQFDWTVIPDVPFRLDDPSQQVPLTIGATEFQQATHLGHLPWDFADLQDGDQLEVIAGESTGRWFEVVKALRADQKTARRIPLREVSAPNRG